MQHQDCGSLLVQKQGSCNIWNLGMLWVEVSSRDNVLAAAYAIHGGTSPVRANLANLYVT